jgi:autotransporter passenger strand-loop-strand repeat protein
VTIVSSGQTLIVLSGQTVTSTVVLSGGIEIVSAGGQANGATVFGLDVVNAGGVESGTVLSSGGVHRVFGSALAETVASGGSAYVSSAGGILKLDDSQHFSGWISGFGVPDGIDLADIAFGSGTTLGYAGNASSGVLTVNDGLHTASIQLLLGQYVEANFTLQSNGHGGTLVVDPPAGDSYAMLTPHS